MQVVTNTLRVLECVLREQPIGVSEIARLLELPKSSVQRALSALDENGWIVRDRSDNRKWMQTPRIWVLAHQGPGVEIRELTMDAQQWLLQQTDENIHVTRQEGDELVVVDKMESTQSIRVFDPIGTRIPLHLSGSGKAILSTWREDALEDYLKRASAQAPSDHLLDVQGLREEMEEIRTRGYSINRGNWRPEISGIGVAVPLSGTGQPAEYGLAISIPTHRLDPDRIEEYGRLLQEGRDRILTAAGITKSNVKSPSKGTGDP